MAVLGIECPAYGVEDVEKSGRFFEDFGLRRSGSVAGVGRFDLPEGSHVLIRHRDDPALPQSSLVGDGVREVIWGVDTETALEALIADLSTDRGMPPINGITRPLFHKVLSEAAVDAGAAIRLGSSIAEIEDRGTQVHVRFNNGSEADYDFVIGCDGVYSLYGLLQRAR
jgi:hypothetical protein